MGGTGRKEEGRRIPSQSVGRTTEIGALELSQLSGEGAFLHSSRLRLLAGFTKYRGDTFGEQGKGL